MQALRGFDRQRELVAQQVDLLQEQRELIAAQVALTREQLATTRAQLAAAQEQLQRLDASLAVQREIRDVARETLEEVRETNRKTPSAPGPR